MGGGSFWAPGPPKLTFLESKRCQFLFILSMGQDGVFQKILTSPISKTDIFLGHPVLLMLVREHLKITHFDRLLNDKIANPLHSLWLCASALFGQGIDEFPR